MPSKQEQTVPPQDGGKRLDVYVASLSGMVSREQARRLIKEGQVQLNSQPVTKPHTPVHAGDVVTVAIPEATVWEVKGENIPLDVVFEDCDVIVVNKPCGLVTHPAAGHADGTLVNALVHHCKDLTGVGGKLRPGLVHRLDKDTSGLLAVAKNEKAYQSLAGQLKDRTMTRVYLAAEHGAFREKQGTIEAAIGRHEKNRKKFAVSGLRGRPAVTHYEVLEQAGLPGKEISLLRVKLETGRTHQIRVHLSYLKHPVVGDIVYGRGERDGVRLMLHAAHLEFIHPRSGKRVKLDAVLPHEIDEFLKGSRKQKT